MSNQICVTLDAGLGAQGLLGRQGAQQSYKFVTLMTNQFSQSSHLEMIVD